MTVFMTLALAFAFSIAVVKDASADALLAPAIRTDGNFVTFVTVVNKSANTSLHWMYRYDDPAVAGNQCYHKDGFAKTTQNDILTCDVSTTFGTGPLPSTDTTSGCYNLGKGWLGLLTIYSFTGAYPGTPTGESSLAGEVAIIDLSTGAAYLYKQLNDFYGTDEGNLDDLAYGSYPLTLPGQAVMPTAKWHPTSIVSTQWLVDVAHYAMATAMPGLTSDCDTMSATIAFADVDGNAGYFYDINENLLSATSGKTVDCFAYLTLSDLIAPASLPDAANGGWAHVQMVSPTPGVCDKGILVYKLESTSSIVSGKTQSGWTSQNRVDW